mmetsp:Transcript_26136/g.60951  ORF Transcript_26136/g.60951 Transcript_26136/m.60951 type:complete len:244 (-) Transcript_26136:201-932(-)
MDIAATGSRIAEPCGSTQISSEGSSHINTRSLPQVLRGGSRKVSLVRRHRALVVLIATIFAAVSSWRGAVQSDAELLTFTSLPKERSSVRQQGGNSPCRACSSLTCRRATSKGRAPQIRPGSRAILRGLDSRPELNGNPVQVVRWDVEREVWIVRLNEDPDDLSSFNVLPENLEVSFAQAQEGNMRSTAASKKDEKEFNPVAALGAVIAVAIAVPTLLFTVVPLGVYMVNTISDNIDSIDGAV